MREKRVFTLLLVFIMIFSLSVPTSAAELVNDMNMDYMDDGAEFVINDESEDVVEVEKVMEAEIQSFLNEDTLNENMDEESVSENDITKNENVEPKENAGQLKSDVSDGNSKENEGDNGNNIDLMTETIPVYNAGNSMSDATTIYAGKTYSGSISSTNNVDWYKITVASSGLVTIDVTAYMGISYYHFFDSAGNELWYDNVEANEVTGMSVKSYVKYLNKGTYYFVVEEHPSIATFYGDYFFILSYTNANESFPEVTHGSNNDIRYANTISLGQGYKGLLAVTDDTDFYKFTLNTSSTLYVKMSATINRLKWYIYDEAGNELKCSWEYCNGTTGIITVDSEVDLKAGVYYFVVAKYDYDGVYSFNLSAISENEVFGENKTINNDSLATASSIATGVTYKGQIALNDSKDFYKFNVSSSAMVVFTSKAYMQRVNYKLFNAKGEEVWYDYSYWNELTKESSFSKSVDLEAGTYYFIVERYSDSSSYTGGYLFEVSIHNHKYKKVVTKATSTTDGIVETKCSCGKVKSSKNIYAVNNIYLSKTTYTYDGKVKKPTVVVKNSQGKRISASNYTVTYSKGRKNVGKYTVTIKFKGNYRGTVKKTFYIYPKKTGITQLISNKRGFTVRFKKTSKQASGYQVQYSTSSSFWWSTTKNVKSGSKSAAKITGLSSNRIYYVRVRVYKKVGGITYYSDWSKAKKVKTK